MCVFVFAIVLLYVPACLIICQRKASSGSQIQDWCCEGGISVIFPKSIPQPKTELTPSWEAATEHGVQYSSLECWFVAFT